MPLGCVFLLQIERIILTSGEKMSLYKSLQMVFLLQMPLQAEKK